MPQNLKWMWLAAAVYLVFIWLERWKRGTLKRYGDPRLLDQMSSSLDLGRRRWKQSMVALAVLLIAAALAEPQMPGKNVFVKSTGLDIVIAVDVSLSMLAQDILPNRLEKAKLELQDLVEKAKGDRIGVVAFAGEAHIQVPLTLDRAAVKLFLKTLSPDIIPTPGTAIGEGIRAALALYSGEAGQNRVLVLLTDGEDQGSKPLEAAREAAKRGVRIYAIGIGTAKGDVIAVRGENGKVDFKKDLGGKTVVSKLDEKTLQEITQLTGGVYYRSRKGNLEIERIYGDLGGLGGKETGASWVVEHEPLYQAPLLAAILFLCVEIIWSERRKHAEKSV